jgi:hypothetical protein
MHTYNVSYEWLDRCEALEEELQDRLADRVSLEWAKLFTLPRDETVFMDLIESACLCSPALDEWLLKIGYHDPEANPADVEQKMRYDYRIVLDDREIDAMKDQLVFDLDLAAEILYEMRKEMREGMRDSRSPWDMECLDSLGLKYVGRKIV